MKQRCVPCQGIERLTPLPIFNRAGLTRLRYRVGQYPEFFQSALAALSDAPPGADPREVLARALDRLRTRDSDDPSIALLDAWAIVADVLTFYQERTANEAFLNTATRHGSLHELSQLLGYAPRPGLSSSVLLSFGVDDRSDEVIIPMGTPAKSTPLPGTPDQPQTFETSEDFVARADWNAIRPRLTRPQPLQKAQLAELERVYVKGRGLRIEPNNWLAIGIAESFEDATLKQVREVEERTNPMGEQVTVVHLVVDPLSVTRLLNEVQRATEEFFDAVGGSPLFEPAVKNALVDYESTFNDILNELREIRFIKGLEYVESELQKRLLRQQLLLDPENPEINLRKYMDQRITEITSIAALYSRATGSAYANALTAYKARHATTPALVQLWRDQVVPLGTPDSGANRRALQEELYWSDELGTPADVAPDLLVGTTLDQASVPDEQPVFEDFEPVASTDTTATEYRVTLEKTVGITLNQLTETAADTGELKTKLKDIIRKSDPAADFSSDIYYHVRDQTDSFLTAGVHVVKTADDNEPYFNGLRPERVLLKGAGVQLNHSPIFLEMGVSLGFSDSDVATANPDLSYQVQILFDNGTDNGVLNDTGGNNKKIAELDPLLRNVMYTAPNTDARRVVIKLTIRQGDVRAIVIRTLLIDGGIRFVRSELAQSLVTTNSLTALQTTLANAHTALTNIGAAATTTLQAAVAENRSIAEAGLRQELPLDSANQTLDAALGGTDSVDGIKQGLQDLEDNDHFAFIRQEMGQSVFQVADDMPETPATSGATAMGQFEARYTTCMNLLAAERDDVTAVRDGAGDSPTLLSFAASIKTSLHQRRSEFVGLLQNAKTDHESSFDPSNTDDSTAKQMLDTVFSTESPGMGIDPTDVSMVARVEALKELPIVVGTSASDLTNTFSKIEELYLLAASVLEGASSLSGLTPDARDAVSLIDARWQRTKASVSGTGTLPDQPDDTASTVSSAQDILKRLLATGGDLSLADALIVLDVLNQGSHLWTQVTAALNPSRRDDILAGFREFRNVSLPTTPRVDVWVFRSQANVFGWNSPGKLERKTFTKTDANPIDQVVMVRDSSELVPKGEEKDLIYLDGKLEDTLAGTPIAIQKPGQDSPGPYWIDEVAFMPRTEYELSGDTTKVTLARPWWQGVNDTFGVIRGTKAWCNAEQLDLAEAILSDDTVTYRVFTPESFPSLELNKFHPFLSAGMKLVVSGIPAPDEPPPDDRRPTRDDPDANMHSELATIVKVSHEFQKGLYDDPVRTTITLLDPLQRSYWRDTVEIAANIVPATHGETVRQTLGSGDARRSFQRFTLSTPPLTRLPTADADGQEPELKVRVNNVLWDGVDRLLGEKGPTETYQVRAQRTGEERIQFGDGDKGSRVPTGQENVRAAYRAGLGLAGNVGAGRIDQLPAPPLGVSSVSNPIPGDGGANPDTVAQSKLRTPRAPIRAGRLISARDYESFALLFAGVDKATAIEEHGGLRLIVAGMTPGPLQEDGMLMQSLDAALKRYGDPNVPVTVSPHVGRLLYVEARLQINERADWEAVKAAVRAAIVGRFGYGIAQLGRDILASDVVATMQSVQHIQSIRLKKLYGFSTADTQQPKPGEKVTAQARVRVDPNELCYVADTVENTIVLEREV